MVNHAEKSFFIYLFIELNYLLRWSNFFNNIFLRTNHRYENSYTC